MGLPILDGALFRITPAATTPFAQLVAQVDRAAQAHLGGREVIYRPAIGAPVPVVGIFDAQYQLAQGDAEVGVETLGPAVFVLLRDLPVDPEQDEPSLLIDNLEYRVTERRPDGFGGVVLALRQVG